VGLAVISTERFSVSEATSEDFSKIRKLHEAMGSRYNFPDLSNPLFRAKTVIRDQNGEITAAGTIKIIGECYLWLASERPIADKLDAIGYLEREMREKAKSEHFDHVAAWLPPGMPKGFFHLLREMGWSESGWNTWARNL